MSKPEDSGRSRPDACPGALQLHDAADGPLARVRLPGGVLTAAQARVLAACAAELGSGIIELTSRANLQVRGLSDPAAFAARLAAADLLPSITHERVRNIVASPSTDRALIDALDRALCARPELAELPGRFLFSIDDIGLEADVTCVRHRLLLAGQDAGFDVPEDAAVSLMLDAAEIFLRLRGTEWRIAELDDGPARIAALLALRSETARANPPHPPGQVDPGNPAQDDLGVVDGGRAVQALVPLGRLHPAQLLALADVADEVRLTPWRTVVVRDFAAFAASATRVGDAAPGDVAGEVVRRLAGVGLVTDSASPWVGVTACTGRPGCGKAMANVHADASAWVLARRHAPATPVHWSGCERRCGLPRGRVLQMVATVDGYDERFT